MYLKFWKFCGLLRIYELQLSPFSIPVWRMASCLLLAKSRQKHWILCIFVWSIFNCIWNRFDRCTLCWVRSFFFHACPKTSEVVLEQQYFIFIWFDYSDLRAGAFHFVEKRKVERHEAKPYQVIFTDSPMAMTWMYPKPRAITRISVFPIPIIAGDEVCHDHSAIIQCSLEYWDKCLKSFQPYSAFALSEEKIK